MTPLVNHWWNVTLYLTARGLGTSPMPYDGREVDIEFDFIDHRLIARTSEGETRALELRPRSVADFYAEYQEILPRRLKSIPGTLIVAKGFKPS